MINHKKILYFSTNRNTIEAFNAFCKRNDLQRKNKFELICHKDDFASVFDLHIYLENTSDDLTSLFVIIDYLSLSCKEKYQDNREMLCDIILAYPEVHFFFDDSYVRYKGINGDYRNFLFEESQDSSLLGSFHSFCVERNDGYNTSFDRLLNQRNNLFDASNLRSCIRNSKYEDLHVHKNFSKIQDSRKNNLAIVVEEEISQCFFNSYLLYTNGFSALPVSTACELMWVNKTHAIHNNIKLILRDSDLQFKDEKNHLCNGYSEIDLIRGYKFNDKVNNFDILDNPDSFTNDFWSNLYNKRTYFITKGYKGGKMIISNPQDRTKDNTLNINASSSNISVWGISKPVNGIYNEIHKINEVKDRFRESRYSLTGDTEGVYKIRIDRKDHDHSTPLDIYEIVRSMVKRSEHYYSAGKFLFAALISSEAIEMMNGFHLTLMLKAYYINAVAENALAVRLLGANEEKLKEDTRFRLAEKVPQDLDRMCQNAPEFKKNMLISIYNEARRFCKMKEHLDSAEVALSLLVHLNNRFEYEKLNIFKIFNKKEETLVDTDSKPANKNKKHGVLAYKPKTKLGFWVKDFMRFVKDFPVSFIVLISMLVLSCFFPADNNMFFYALLALYLGATCVLVMKPMQIVYGLIGTKGDISKFIIMFAVVVMCFTTTYYNAFFKDSGLTYDVDLPQVEYNLFSNDIELKDSGIVKTMNQNIDIAIGRYVDCCDESFVHDPDKQCNGCRYYKRITFPFVLRQTFLTSLTTSPTEFFNCVSADYKNNDKNPKYTRLFNLILLYQIIISWIFLGVFISLIYQKFRNE